MVKIIRKKKRLFEDDNQTAAPANNQPTSNTTTPASPANNQQNNTQPTTNNSVTQAPTDNTNQQQPANNQQVTNNDQQQQQPAQDQNQQQNQQQPNQNQQAVLDILKNMENQYWCIANNVPEMIKEKIPDFKPDNAEAAPIIKNWDAFKQNPSEQTFNAFIDSFKNFGNIQNQEQQQNVQESLKRKAITDFRSLLESRLQQANQDKFTENVCKYYF